ncbi:MAG: hypothetical protein QNK26_09050 [Moritella sp.]|uniref:hypothetical protein n=1 Tax=Moritella sp. TaxID=78556 RepID=UPI0029A9933A|nr:hypothetical protein [Moritella sp.]MDX2320726.1 hypothetical protein [Moritella sp.]
MITDQQTINPENFEPSILPENIHVHFIQREQVSDSFYQGMQGYILKAVSMRNIKTSVRFQQKIHNKLFIDTLNINIPFSEQNQLFLFNDRNKLARLFRLAFADYLMIEEGIANYLNIELKPLERILNRVMFNNRQFRYFGDDARCKAIYLLTPEKAPKALQHKTHLINFVDHDFIETYLYRFFKYDLKLNYSVIIATQPYFANGLDTLIYRKIFQKLKEHGIYFAIKSHPKENSNDYLNIFPDTEFINNKIPLELMIFGAKEKCNILSICTSAGTGFENYCRRLNLISDDELDNMFKIFSMFADDNSLIDQKIEQKIEQLLAQK